MLLRIVAIRHAKPESEGYADEKLRPLSEEGIAIQIRMARHLNELAITPHIIYTSPLVRARETAQILSDELQGPPVTPMKALGYAFNPEQILSNMPHPKENKTIFLVGHNPTLAEFVNLLVGEIVLPAGFSKSGAAVVDFRTEPSYGEGEFAGYYTPQSI